MREAKNEAEAKAQWKPCGGGLWSSLFDCIALAGNSSRLCLTLCERFNLYQMYNKRVCLHMNGDM